MNITVRGTTFMTNPEINPTFLENTALVLDKDYTQTDPFCSRYLIKNVLGLVSKCGLSKYAYDSETQEFTKLVDGADWCFIEILTPVADFDSSECFVKAEDLIDLKTLSEEDLINRGLW